MEILKSIPVFPEGMLQTEIRVPLLQFKVFRPAWPFFGKWNWCHCTHGKRDSGTKLTSLEFCLPLVRTWSHWFAHVNGETTFVTCLPPAIPREIAFITSILKRVQSWRVSWMIVERFRAWLHRGGGPYYVNRPLAWRLRQALVSLAAVFGNVTQRSPTKGLRGGKRHFQVENFLK